MARLQVATPTSWLRSQSDSDGDQLSLHGDHLGDGRHRSARCGTLKCSAQKAPGGDRRGQRVPMP
jgi:hypothetical protein